MSNANVIETRISKEEVFETIINHARDILGAELKEVKEGDSFVDIGANSIDRADIIMSALESLLVNIPLVELANARNIGELAEIIHAKS